MRALRRVLIVSVIVTSLVGGVAVSAAGVPGGLGNRTVAVGSTYTMLGQTGTLHAGAARATGPVTLSGRWDGVAPRCSHRPRQPPTAAFASRSPCTGAVSWSYGSAPDHRVERVVLTVV